MGGVAKNKAVEAANLVAAEGDFVLRAQAAKASPLQILLIAASAIKGMGLGSWELPNSNGARALPGPGPRTFPLLVPDFLPL